MKKLIVVVLLSILLLFGGFFLYKWIVHSMHYVSTDDARVQGNMVAVSSKVAARILFLGADNGDKVKKGQVLARLDDRDFKALLAQSESQAQAARIDEDRQRKLIAVNEKEAHERIGQARDVLKSSEKSLEISRQDKELNLDTAKANVERQKASLDGAKAQVLQASANYEEADRETRRAANLYKDGALPLQGKEHADTQKKVAFEVLRAARKNVKQQEYLLEVARATLRAIPIKDLQVNNARNTVDSSDKGVALAEMAEEKIEVDREQLRSLAAKKREMESKVRYNRLMLNETTVYSPVDGIVAKRNSNMGEMAAPGVPLFYVADANDLWVSANIEEGQIRRVAVGAEVEINVDAFPRKAFKGTVEFIGPVTSSELSLFPSDNPSGTFIKVAHRLPVRIKVTDSDRGLLKPGMNVVVDVTAH